MIKVRKEKVAEMVKVFANVEKAELEKMLDTSIEIVRNNPKDIANHELVVAILEALVQKQA